ncbi:thiamine phosphate synthase [Thiomicrospira sp. ALE5]|uniref:thiamine phosphate synthase n=1 Tax=Thiomicrospira sp. ALE5 TaxID=748650 RepID=UPI001F331D38|nr:thiamine phosphate synthase [Thiomicrospira sp. ALE5]
MESNVDLSLYLILDPSRCLHPPLEVATAAARGGISLIQLRDKRGDEQACLALAEQLKQRLDDFNLPLIINDSVAIAQAAKAAGVHLGQGDGDLAQARATLGPHAIIGRTAPNAAALQADELAYADYVGHGPVYATATKQNHLPPIGWAGATAGVALSHKPVVLIGGLGLADVKQVYQTGAQGLAVASAICGADDPAAVTRQFRQAWLSAMQSAPK